MIGLLVTLAIVYLIMGLWSRFNRRKDGNGLH